MATSYRVERPFPGDLGKGSVNAKWQLVPTVGFFDSDVQFPASVWACPLSLLERGSTAVQDTAPTLPCSLKPQPLLHPMRSLGWLVRSGMCLTLDPS